MKPVTLCEHGATQCRPALEGHGQPHDEFVWSSNGYATCRRCGQVKPRKGWAGKCIGLVAVKARRAAR